MSNKSKDGDPIVRFIAANKRVSNASILKRFGRSGEARLRVLQLKGEIELKGHQGRKLWVIPETRITDIESMTLTSEGIETVFRTKRAGVTSKVTHLEKQKMPLPLKPTAMIVPDGKGGVEINHPEGTPHFFDRSEEAEAKRLTVADVVRIIDKDIKEAVDEKFPDSVAPQLKIVTIPKEKVEEILEEMSEEMKAKLAEAGERGAAAGKALREKLLARGRTMWIGFSNCDHSASYLEGESPPETCPTCGEADPLKVEGESWGFTPGAEEE